MRSAARSMFGRKPPALLLAHASGVAWLLVVATLPEGVLAQARDLRGDPRTDAAIAGVGAAAWVAADLDDASLGPSRCRWCSVGGFDARARAGLVWSRPAVADTLSNVGAWVLAPIAAFGLDAAAAAHDGAGRDTSVDTILVLEAAVLAADVNKVTKLLVARERPFSYALGPEGKRADVHSPDDDESFFSGHASATFAIAAASGTVASMRGYRWAPLVWSEGLVVATAVAYLRVAADKHWLTDVVAGAVVGAAIGFAVPYVFHGPTGSPSAPGRQAPAMLTYSLVF